MSRFRKKPVLVEAEQWFPGKHVNGVTEETWMPDGGTADGKPLSLQCGYCFTIHGQQTKVVPGDWIITEPDGVHHYPCNPDIFASTYEPA